MGKKEKLKTYSLTPEQATTVVERVQPYFDKYIESMRMGLMFHNKDNHLRTYRLKELMISCYAQGLEDGSQVVEHIKQRDED